MKLWSVFVKTMKEQGRDPWVVALSVFLGPIFVLMYYSFFNTGNTGYRLLLETGGRRGAVIERLEADLAKVPGLVVEMASDKGKGERQLKDRSADAMLVLPGEFESRLRAMEESGGKIVPIPYQLVGDLTNPKYVICAIFASDCFTRFVQERTGANMPVALTETALGGSGIRTEFDAYVPGLLVLAVVLLVFQTAISVARELESGTYQRLRISPLRPLDFLGGLSLFQVLCGVASVCLTFGTAYLCGFRSQGPLWTAMVIGAITTLPVVGIGLMVAVYSGTVARAFVVANFPLIMLMFFTGAIFPIGEVLPVTIAGKTLGLFDLLPPTHAVSALNKILTLGEGLGGVTFELVSLLVLSVLYFAGGIILYCRRQAKV